MTKQKAVRTRLSPARKTAIIDTAWEAFLEKGFSDTSMSEISERLGGSKATLYNYFQSKEELFLAVVQRKMDELYAELSYLPKQLNDLPKDLTDYGCRLLDIVLSKKYMALQRLTIAELARFPMVSSTEYDNRRQAMLGPLSERLHDQMKLRRLRLADPLETSEVFWNLCSASIHRRLLMTTAPSLSKKEIRHIVKQAVAVFLAAYGLPDEKNKLGQGAN